ncbi:MAG: YbaM family protein [Psychromonas sp.]
MNEESHNLTNAPVAVQIAVDLIQLLEENKIETHVAIEALQIVLNDFKKKAQVD